MALENLPVLETTSDPKSSNLFIIIGTINILSFLLNMAGGGGRHSPALNYGVTPSMHSPEGKGCLLSRTCSMPTCQKHPEGMLNAHLSETMWGALR